MKDCGIKKRIAAMLLTAVMALSMTGYTFEGVYAAAEDGGAEEGKTAAAQTLQAEADDSGDGAQPGVLPADEEASAESKGDAQIGTDGSGEEAVDEQLPDADASGSDALNDEEAASADEDAGRQLSASAADQTAEIPISIDRNDNRVIDLSWEHFSGAEYYTVSLDDGSPQTIDAGSAQEEQVFSHSFSEVDPKKAHTVIVKAYRARTEADEAGAGDIMIAEGTAADINAWVTADNMRNPVSGVGRVPQNLGINLRTLLGEGHGGYAVSQGGCTDGTYAYYLLVSSSNQMGRILKTTVGSNTVVARSGVINVCHGNGMTINTRTRQLVVVGREERRNQLTVINADNLSEVSYVNVRYDYSGSWDSYTGKGLSAIKYIEKYDCYVALMRSTHEILVLNTDFNVVAQVGTVITAKYPGTYQAMDADERYVYLLLSYYNSSQPHNIILALDWNSENLLDVVNGKKTHIKKSWKCNDDGSGKPDAVIRTNTPYEAENIYHIDQGDGTARFYLSEYYKNPQYHYVTKNKAYKVKWKKVKKKVKWKKVKKKVKVKGKWKTKKVWKYKTKKVWKYKTKYKKVKEKELNYYNRDNYVYDLGII